MAKKQITQPVGIKQQGSSTSALAELNTDDQLSLPADETVEEGQVCPKCGDEIPVGMECQTCAGVLPNEPITNGLTCAVADEEQAVGQTVHQTQTSAKTQPSSFGGAEEQCPNCHGKRYFTEKVMNEEGKPVVTQVWCERCNGRGYIIIPLYSPVLAQEKSMANEWPTDRIELNWPWVDEPDPTVGTIVGWNWERKEVAVIVDQPQYLNMKPWKVAIELRPMSEHLEDCIVICINEPIVHRDPVWYSAWTRTGKKTWIIDEQEFVGSFFGKCVVQELVKELV